MSGCYASGLTKGGDSWAAADRSALVGLLPGSYNPPREKVAARRRLERSDGPARLGRNEAWRKRHRVVPAQHAPPRKVTRNVRAHPASSARFDTGTTSTNTRSLSKWRASSFVQRRRPVWSIIRVLNFRAREVVPLTWNAAPASTLMSGPRFGLQQRADSTRFVRPTKTIPSLFGLRSDAQANQNCPRRTFPLELAKIPST